MIRHGGKARDGQVRNLGDDRALGISRAGLLVTRPQPVGEQLPKVVKQDLVVIPLAKRNRTAKIENVARGNLIGEQAVGAEAIEPQGRSRVMRNCLSAQATARSNRDRACADAADFNNFAVEQIENGAARIQVGVIQTGVRQARHAHNARQRSGQARGQGDRSERADGFSGVRDGGRVRVAVERAVLVRVARRLLRDKGARVATEHGANRNRINVAVEGSQSVFGVAIASAPQARIAKHVAHIRPRVGGKGRGSGALSLYRRIIKAVGIDV